MLPSHLSMVHFAEYPPRARAVAQAHLELLRQLPLAFLPSLLRELIEYDYKFPAELAQLDRQLAYIAALTAAELADCFARFAQIRLSSEQTSFDWCARPHAFTEQLSAYLWRTHQTDAFREAAVLYGDRLQSASVPVLLPMPRLGMAIIGQGAAPHQPGLFRKLREHGTLFTNIEPAGGLATMVSAVELRAQMQPSPYAHWYVDGGLPLEHSSGITAVDYAALTPARARLLAFIQNQVSRPGMGPEELRDRLTQLSPAELGLRSDSVVDHLLVKVLAEGSGTQIFSTTFAQWTAREVLRRAEPLTLLIRFAPRQRQRPMNELLADDQGVLQLDPEGSLVDADMAAYYHWLNQQRLSGAQESAFLVWFEGQRQVLAVSPGLPRGTTSGSAMTMASLLSIVTGSAMNWSEGPLKRTGEIT